MKISLPQPSPSTAAGGRWENLSTRQLQAQPNLSRNVADFLEKNPHQSAASLNNSLSKQSAALKSQQYFRPLVASIVTVLAGSLAGLEPSLVPGLACAGLAGGVIYHAVAQSRLGKLVGNWKETVQNAAAQAVSTVEQSASGAKQKLVVDECFFSDGSLNGSREVRDANSGKVLSRHAEFTKGPTTLVFDEDALRGEVQIRSNSGAEPLRIAASLTLPSGEKDSLVLKAAPEDSQRFESDKAWQEFHSSGNSTFFHHQAWFYNTSLDCGSRVSKFEVTEAHQVVQGDRMLDGAYSFGAGRSESSSTSYEMLGFPLVTAAELKGQEPATPEPPTRMVCAGSGDIRQVCNEPLQRGQARQLIYGDVVTKQGTLGLGCSYLADVERSRVSVSNSQGNSLTVEGKMKSDTLCYQMDGKSLEQQVLDDGLRIKSGDLVIEHRQGQAPRAYVGVVDLGSPHQNGPNSNYDLGAWGSFKAAIPLEFLCPS